MFELESHNDDIDTESAEPLTPIVEAIMSELDKNQAGNVNYEQQREEVEGVLAHEISHLGYVNPAQMAERINASIQFLIGVNSLDTNARHVSIPGIMRKVRQEEALLSLEA